LVAVCHRLFYRVLADSTMYVSFRTRTSKTIGTVYCRLL
jgi:hypothetical protein